jgi:hypothetical protein
MNKKLKFYIYFGIPYDPYTGGIVALHKLLHNLSFLGEEAYINTIDKNPNWLGKSYNDNDDIDYDNSIIIYPEVIHDNPLNFKYTVRWLLYERNTIFSKNDWIYSFWDYFKPNKENHDQLKGLLSAFDFQKNVFYDKGGRIPGSTCYVVRKGSNKELNKHPKDALQIDDYKQLGGNEYLSEVFSKHEFFISYDDATFLTIQAALCGCIPIIIPNDNISEDVWRNGIDLHKYGHSYGLNNIQYAINTRKQLLDVIEQMENKSLKQTKQFIEDCYKNIYGD